MCVCPYMSVFSQIPYSNKIAKCCKHCIVSIFSVSNTLINDLWQRRMPPPISSLVLQDPHSPMGHSTWMLKHRHRRKYFHTSWNHILHGVSGHIWHKLISLHLLKLQSASTWTVQSKPSIMCLISRVTQQLYFLFSCWCSRKRKAQEPYTEAPTLLTALVSVCCPAARHSVLSISSATPTSMPCAKLCLF